MQAIRESISLIRLQHLRNTVIICWGFLDEVFEAFHLADVHVEFLERGEGFVGLDEALLEVVFVFFELRVGLFGGFVVLGFYGLLGELEEGGEVGGEGEGGAVLLEVDELLEDGHFVIVGLHRMDDGFIIVRGEQGL